MFTVCTTPPPEKKPGVVQRLKPAKSNIYARPRAGLFFCLASAEGAGLLFLPCYTIQPHTSVYSAFCIVNATLYSKRHKAACRTLQALFLRFHPLNRQRYQTDTSGYNTACTTLERITAPHRTLYRSAQHPIIIRYIRVQGCTPVVDPCQTVQQIADRASPVASRCFPRPTAGSGRNHWRLAAASLFGLSPDSQ